MINKYGIDETNYQTQPIIKLEAIMVVIWSVLSDEQKRKVVNKLGKAEPHGDPDVYTEIMKKHRAEFLKMIESNEHDGS